MRYVTLFGLLLVGCGPPAVQVPPPNTSKSVPRESGPVFQTAPVPKSTPAPAEYSIAKTPPAFSFNIQQFWEEINRSPKDARKKYQGQVIELTGFVKGLATLPTGQAMLYLQAGASPLGFPCQFREEKHPDGVAQNQLIRIKGKWPEQAENACLVDCVVMQK